jgi:hypothetical protein
MTGTGLISWTALETLSRILPHYASAWPLGESAASLADNLGIRQPAVSMSVRRREEILKDMGIELLPKEPTYELMDVPGVLQITTVTWFHQPLRIEFTAYIKTIFSAVIGSPLVHTIVR